MIITDIKQIDYLAEELLAQPSGLISVDMQDYTFIKEHSKVMKAIKLEARVLDEEIVSSLNEALSEAGKDAVTNILFYISGNGSTASVKAISMEQMQIYLKVLQDHAETANIIWGLGDDDNDKGNITILVVIGYNK